MGPRERGFTVLVFFVAGIFAADLFVEATAVVAAFRASVFV